MKRLFLLILPAFLLFSCKKDDPINPAEVRLLQTKWTDGNGNLFTTLLDYDAEGRIIRLSHQTNNNPPKVYANVTYSGNEVRMVETGESNAASAHTREVKFVLDGNNQPQSRIELITNEYFPPQNWAQRDFFADTAIYIYDGQGLLLKKTGTSRDSVWSNNGSEQTSVRTKTHTTDYTTTNGNLSSVVRTSQENYRLRTAYSTYTSQGSEEDRYTFEYSQAYANQTDFKNAFLLEEFSVLLSEYPLNKNYRNLPDKINSSSVSRSGTGAIISSSSNSGTVAFSYNKYGFLATMGSHPDPAQNKQFIYSR